eukprot:3561-Heterococcus_DN1.PRE.3
MSSRKTHTEVRGATESTTGPHIDVHVCSVAWNGISNNFRRSNSNYSSKYSRGDAVGGIYRTSLSNYHCCSAEHKVSHTPGAPD